MAYELRLSASLTFRGFDLEPSAVEDLVGTKAKAFGRKGELVKLGVKTRLVRSYSAFEINFESSENVFAMIPALLIYLGGLDHLKSVQERLAPEFIDVNLVLPFKNFDEQTNGWIDQESIAALHRLAATLSFEFL
jgi:hypothetical protein